VCTIVVLSRVHADYPLVVAANRDEFYERVATEPQVLNEGPRVVGGLDVEKGGTWLGVTDGGLFVGLTNQRTWEGFDTSLRSRGDVAMKALSSGSLAGALDYLRGIEPQRYNPFNLLVGDASGVHVAYARRSASEIELEPLPPGIHVLANGRMGSPDFPKTERAHRLVEQHARCVWPELREELSSVLADHELPAEDSIPDPPEHSNVAKRLLQQLQALCVHTPLYGTRSATLLAIDEGHVVQYLYAHGAPCQTSFRDVTALLR
jgi:uncharacterized protein with NRDE domain